MISVATAGGSDGGSDDPIRQAQAILMRLGAMKFGPPSHEIETTIRGIAELSRLEVLCERLLAAASWRAVFEGEGFGA